MEIIQLTRANYKRYLPGIRSCYLKAYQSLARAKPQMAFCLTEVHNVLRVHLSDEDFVGHYFHHGRDQANAFWVAVRDKVVVGTRSAHLLENDTCELDHLSVHPDAQRTGVAKALYRTSEAYAMERGCKYTALFAWQENTGARALQTKMGYMAINVDYANVPSARNKLCVYSTKSLIRTPKPIKKRKL